MKVATDGTTSLNLGGLKFVLDGRNMVARHGCCGSCRCITLCVCSARVDSVELQRCDGASADEDDRNRRCQGAEARDREARLEAPWGQLHGTLWSLRPCCKVVQLVAPCFGCSERCRGRREARNKLQPRAHVARTAFVVGVTSEDRPRTSIQRRAFWAADGGRAGGSAGGRASKRITAAICRFMDAAHGGVAEARFSSHSSAANLWKQTWTFSVPQ